MQTYIKFKQENGYRKESHEIEFDLNEISINWDTAGTGYHLILLLLNILGM